MLRFDKYDTSERILARRGALEAGGYCYSLFLNDEDALEGLSADAEVHNVKSTTRSVIMRSV